MQQAIFRVVVRVLTSSYQAAHNSKRRSLPGPVNMISVRTSRNFVGSIISLRGSTQLEDWKFPVSVKDFAESNQFREFSGNISTGDVDCTWLMHVWQNGFWSAQGQFHDGGTVAGDFFFLDLLLDHDHSIGAKLEGSILNVLDSRHLEVDKNGSDSWIRDNWSTFESSGPTVRLHAAPAVGDLVALPLIALAAVPSVVFIIAAAVIAAGAVILNLVQGGTYEMRRCPDTLLGPDNAPLPGATSPQNPCLQIVRIPPPGQE
jgi:hypothetical protein